MATIWNKVKKYATQVGLIYNNEEGKTYNEQKYNYDGKLITAWSKQSKS